VVLDGLIRQLALGRPFGVVSEEPDTTVEGGSQGGALDIVLCRSNGPDIVVEIDSEPERRSALELACARQAGAITVWVRFGEGRVAPST
jgi:hypothetical protein